MQDLARARGLLEQRQHTMRGLLRVLLLPAACADEGRDVADDPELIVILVDKGCELFYQISTTINTLNS